MADDYAALKASMAEVQSYVRETFASDLEVTHSRGTMRRRRCAGLPRTYPMFWMHMPHSNSLMIEWKLMQSITIRKASK